MHLRTCFEWLVCYLAGSKSASPFNLLKRNIWRQKVVDICSFLACYWLSFLCESYGEITCKHCMLPCVCSVNWALVSRSEEMGPLKRLKCLWTSPLCSRNYNFSTNDTGMTNRKRDTRRDFDETRMERTNFWHRNVCHRSGNSAEERRKINIHAWWLSWNK